ncbi:formate dehydrogenase accessory sulfurtransferase FdhD [Polaribacter sp.]|uniref:formate dehydrogenase accessory sulfurtransferase FdhD n=1 Tax=Polaribacter sp. TaxID=1920175 RepID=UPI0025CECCD6|nr:formate dehydrogenase accessory sulfurtransferase FdhD [Polaribacter sp.]
MQSTEYHGLKIVDSNQTKVNDFLVIEAPLQININAEPYTVVMRTPSNDFELIRGLLYAEDIYKANKEIEFTIIEEQENIPTIIKVTIPDKELGKGYLNKRTLLSVSSCGICGKKELKDLTFDGKKLKDSFTLTANHIHKMYTVMNSLQETYIKTGGSHAAALFSSTRKMLSVNEDIGRHNAVDKVIGDLILKNNLKEAFYLLVSGRVSYEIVTKAFIAKIPIIVAVSACSSLAVDFAKEFGICLIGFTRQHKMTVYANTNAIINTVADE